MPLNFGTDTRDADAAANVDIMATSSRGGRVSGIGGSVLTAGGFAEDEEPCSSSAESTCDLSESASRIFFFFNDDGAELEAGVIDSLGGILEYTVTFNLLPYVWLECFEEVFVVMNNETMRFC